MKAGEWVGPGGRDRFGIGPVCVSLSLPLTGSTRWSAEDQQTLQLPASFASSAKSAYSETSATAEGAECVRALLTQ